VYQVIFVLLTVTRACTPDTQVITVNGTKLTQNSSTFQDTCRYEIPRQPGVCQIRLDFVDFNIDEGPDVLWLGDCSTDTLVITGNSNGMLGPLCGNLQGQHSDLQFISKFNM
jgi:hypothetical protein